MTATAPGAAPAASRSRARLTAFLLTSAFAAVAAVVAGVFVSQFIEDTRTVYVLLGAAWAVLSFGFLAWYVDIPEGHGRVYAELGFGLAAGIVGAAFLTSLVDDATAPWWSVAAGAGFGLARAHAPILQFQRAKDEPPQRIGGILDVREIGALVVLVTGYALLGVAALRIFDLFRGIIPDAQQALTIGIATYALYGARLLLRFASHDANVAGAGFLAWFKANLLRNGIIVLLLVAYYAYRENLAEIVPFFPLVEFGLGMALFGALLARLRWALKNSSTEHASASDARPHTPRIETITEGEYEALARPVSRFIETGRGPRDYEAAIRETARLDGHESQRILDPVRRYRAQHEDPPLPLAWAIGASLAAGLAVALGVGTGLVSLTSLTLSEDAPLPEGLTAKAFQLGLAVFGLALYRTQDHARAHRQPWLGAGLAAGGTAVIALAAAFFVRGLGGPAWWLAVVAAGALLMGGVPLLASWTHARRLAAAQSDPPLPAELPSAVLAKGVEATKRAAVTAAVGAVVLLVVVPFVLRWVVKVGAPAGITDTYDAVLDAAVWVLVAIGVSALVRYAGLTRARPRVAAIERRRRMERVELHSEIMRRMERV